MTDFTDLFSQYATKRFANVSDAFSDPGQYLTNRVANRLDINTSTVAEPEVLGPAAPAIGPTLAAGRGQQPENPLNQFAGAGRGFVNPPVVQPGPAIPSPQLPQPRQLESNVPGMTPQDLYTAQMESGNNPNIGYHNPKLGTAYGTFGITAPAYKDIQQANPAFAGRPIESLTPEEQVQANHTLQDLNKRRLSHYGVEPSQGNINLAHFLGAKGAADYLQSGYISPAAAAANGGEENVRRIAQARLAGGVAPSSGALNQPQGAVAPTAMPAAPTAAPAEAAPAETGPAGAGQGLRVGGLTAEHLDVLNSKDPKRLMAAAFDLSSPPIFAKMALNQLNDDVQYNAKMQKYQQIVDSDLATGRIPNINKKGEEGSYIKAILFARLGLNDLARQEQDKISPSTTFSAVALPGGEQYSVKFNKNTNQVLAAFDSTGAEVTDSKKLGEIAANALAASQLGKSGATMYRDEKGNQWSEVPTPQGTRFVNIATGAIGRPEGRITPITAGSDLETYRARALIDLNKRMVGATQEQRLKYFEDTNKALVAQGMQPITPAEMGVSLTPQLAPAPTQPGALAQPTAPAVAPAQPQIGAVAPTPVAPTPAAPAAGPAVPGTTPAAPVALPPVTGAPTTAVPGVRPTLQQMQEEERKKKQALEVGTDEMKRFNKYAEEDITPKADAGGRVSAIRKQQIKGPDGILANPELAGLMQGQGGAYDEVRNIIRDLVTGNYKDSNDLSRRVASLDLTQRQKDVLYTQIGLNAALAPETLRANAGPGAISEAEHKLNNQANVDITRQPLYSGLSLMTRSQFVNDMAVARNDFKARHPELTTADQFNSAWNAEKGRLEKEYESIYAERAKYIAKYNKDGKNPGAVVDAYKYYPVPEFDTEKRQWVYGGYSDKARRPKLDSFVR